MSLTTTLLRGSLALLVCLTCSCSRGAHLDRVAADAFQVGSPETGKAVLTRRIEKKMPDDGYTKCGDAVWLLLDRGILHLACDERAEAIHDFRLALNAIDYYNGTPLDERFTQLIFDDRASAYSASDNERILAHLYFSLALHQAGDHENAIALLRGAETLQQELSQGYASNELYEGIHVQGNPAARYLLAALIERSDRSNAEILYAQAGVASPAPSPATLLVVGHGGLAPHKISESCDPGIVSLAALEAQYGGGADLSMLVGFKVPALTTPLHSPPMWVAVDNDSAALTTLFSVTSEAYREHEEKLPFLAARAAARVLSRRLLVASANEESRDALNLLTLIANVATEADTRQWGLLPDQITLARFDLQPGVHTLSLPGREEKIVIHSGETAIIQLFYPTSEVVYALIPDKNRPQKGVSL